MSMLKFFRIFYCTWGDKLEGDSLPGLFGDKWAEYFLKLDIGGPSGFSGTCKGREVIVSILRGGDRTQSAFGKNKPLIIL
jgi:hypothetical protein